MALAEGVDDLVYGGVGLGKRSQGEGEAAGEFDEFEFEFLFELDVLLFSGFGLGLPGWWFAMAGAGAFVATRQWIRHVVVDDKRPGSSSAGVILPPFWSFGVLGSLDDFVFSYKL